MRQLYAPFGDPSTQEAIVELCALLRVGMGLVRACGMVGLTPRSVQLWRKRGESGDTEFADFALRVNNAEADFIQFHMKKINDSEDWKASAWALERKFPKEFGKLAEEAGDKPLADLSPEQLVALIAGIPKLLAAKGEDDG